MAGSQSPGYPNYALPKALDQVRKIIAEDRRNAIGREVAAKHIGYSSLSGASEKALATLAHYDLLERSGKGQTAVTQTAMDIVYPENDEAGRKALIKAATSPAVFKNIDEAFPDTPSDGALENWLVRENFLNRAIKPVIKAYLGTRRYLEQQGAIESGSPSADKDANQDEPVGNGVVYGGAQVGDLIQWEVDGILRLEKPLAVRHITPDGEWVAVEGSETGIPMSQVIVQSGPKHTLPPIGSKPAPTFALETLPPAYDSGIKPTDEPNQIKIVQNGDSLNIHCDNVTAKGLRALRKKLEMYSTILEMDEDDE